ncbi:MAG TPA: hypothetical protein VKV06_14330 [Acidimicrobiales bacterium]|nr:hypothetical protein [Acidimicrobiales bacterium]
MDEGRTAPDGLSAAPSHSDQDNQPRDALALLGLQNRILSDLFKSWHEHTATLTEGDNVSVRWERGSATKLILQHLAVRESAKEAITGRLRKIGRDDLAGRIEGDGVGRREAIDRLDELIRGMMAMNTNTPEVDVAVEQVGRVFREEAAVEDGELLAAASQALQAAGEELPSDRSIRLRSPTHPSPVPRWYDRIGALKALRAFYDHLRGNPSGAIPPGLDEAREQLPGPGH